MGIVDIHKPLGKTDIQYGLFISLSTGVYYSLACRWLISEKPIRDRSRLKNLLELSRDDLKEYKKIGAFYVPAKDSRLD
jgi:hypothetical protein